MAVRLFDNPDVRRRLKFSALWALGLACYNALVFIWVRSDPADLILGPFGLSRRIALVISMPTIAFMRALGILPYNQMNLSGDRTEPCMLGMAFGLNLILYFAVVYYLMFAMERRREKKLVDPQGVRRRDFMVMGGVALAGAGCWGYLNKDRERVRVVEHDLALSSLPRELDGLKLVLIADMHCGIFTSAAYLKRCMETVNALEPDLVLVAGDYVYRGHGNYQGVEAALKTLRPRIGVLGTMGNHDFWQGVENSRRAVRSAGVRLLDNDRLFLNRSRELVSGVPSEGGLCLAGVGDLWEDKVDFARALRAVPKTMPRLVLSHNPDTVENEALRDLRVDAILAAHTHGGQVVLPLIGALALPSVFGIKYCKGWVNGPHCPVYVNVGLGETVLPVRSGVRPEITMFTLVSRS